MGALPQGITVDQPPDTLPAGVSVDAGPSTTGSGPPTDSGFLTKIGEAAENFAIGGLKSAGESLNALGGLAVNPIYKAVTGKEAPPSSVPPVEGTAQKAGAFGEQVAEWFTGEEALKGLSLLEKFPEAAKIISKLPGGQSWVAKLMASATRSGAVGASEGLLHPEGQTPEKAAVTGAAGGAAGALAGEAIAKALPEIPGLIHGRLSAEELQAKPLQARLQPAANVTNGEVIEYAASHGIKLTPGEATGSAFRTGMEGLGKRSLGGSILEDAIERNKTQFNEAITKFTDRLDPSKLGVTEESTGAALQQATETAKAATNNRVHNAYSQLPLDLQDTVVDLRPIWKEWMSRWNADLTVIKNLPDAAKAELENVYKLGASIGTEVEGRLAPRMSFADAIRIRSAIRELGSTPGVQLADRVEGLYRQLGHDMSEAMDKTAEDAGFKGNWEIANSIAKRYHDNFGDRQSPLYRILAQRDPAAAARTVINRMSANDIQILKNFGVDLKPLQRFVVDDIAKAGYRVNSSGLGGYSDAFLNELLGPAKDELYRAAAVGRRLGFEVNPSGTSNVLANEWTLGQLVGGATALATGHPLAAAGALAPSAITIGASLPRKTTAFLPRVISPAEVAARNVARAAGGTAGRVAFRASDGSIHSVPSGQFDHAKQIDPGLTVIQ